MYFFLVKIQDYQAFVLSFYKLYNILQFYIQVVRNLKPKLHLLFNKSFLVNELSLPLEVLGYSVVAMLVQIYSECALENSQET